MLFVFVNLQDRLVSSMNLKCINVLFCTGIVLLYKVMLQLQNVAALHIFNCLHIQNYLNCEVTSLCTISLDDFWLRMFGYLCCVKQIYYFLIIDVAVLTCSNFGNDRPVYNNYMFKTIAREELLLLHPFNGLLSRTTWASGYKKGKTSLKLSEARDDDVLGNSGISWTICRQSASRSRQITTPTPHHSIFTGRMLFLTPYRQYQSKE